MTSPYNLHSDKSWDDTIRELNQTFIKWSVTEWTVSPVRPSKDDRKVTLRYLHPSTNRWVELNMEKQWNARLNLRVLYLAVDAIRLNERRGLGDITASAYLQLAAPTGHRDPYEVLGVRPDADFEDIQAVYRAKAKRLHPDAGGSEDAMTELNAALEHIINERKP